MPAVSASRVLVLVAAVCAARGAAAQTGGDSPELGEGWRREAGETEDAFVRADGMRIELVPASLPCAKQLRVHEVPRHAWLSTTYWPLMDTAGNALLLCVETGGGPVAVTVKPPAGQRAEPELAPALTRLAELLSPPAMTASLGPIASSLNVLEARGDQLFVEVGDLMTSLAIDVHDQGSCPMADPDIARCVETREGFVAITVGSGAAPDALDDLMATILRVARARFGDPQINEADPWRLPRTQQLLAGADPRTWKVVDGAAYGLPGGDVLLPLGTPTHAIGIREGPCQPGTTAAPYEFEALFPRPLGRIWIEREPRPRAWVCLRNGDVTATIALIGGGLPEIADPVLAPLLADIAGTYGVSVGDDAHDDATDYPGRGAVALAAAYLSWITLGPESGRRRNGGLLGVNARVANNDGRGFAFAFNCELGFGDGQLLGEVRTAAGVSLGRRVVFEALLGGGVGSLGPAATLDLHAEAGVSIPFGPRGLVWLGGLRTLGLDGPDHSQVELRMSLPRGGGSSSGGYYLASRYIDFPEGDGDAFVMSFGAGVTARD